MIRMRTGSGGKVVDRKYEERSSAVPGLLFFLAHKLAWCKPALPGWWTEDD